MNTGVLLTSTLWLLFAPGQTNGPTQTTRISNTFVTAAETVIDDSSAVNVKAPDPEFDAQMQQLKVAKDNLGRMASNDRERDIVSSMNDLVFALSACHIQAKDGADTQKCEAQVQSARTRTMDGLNKHKSGNSWVDGPPS